MPYRTVNGLRMYYQLQGSGPAVILLHGLGSCAEDWWLQLPVLSERYRVLAPDLRGHGRTDKPPRPYTVPQMAEDVVRLMGALDIDQAHVVGLSLGGLVAQALATGYETRVRSLVLVNTFARLRVGGPAGWWRLLRRGLVLIVGGVGRQAELVAQAMFPHRGQEAVRRAAVERLRANDPSAYQAAMLAALRFKGWDRLPSIRAPTLVVAGAEDTTVDLVAKEELAAGIPGARLEMIPGSGHATPIDRPAHFNWLLLQFLREVESSTCSRNPLLEHPSPPGRVGPPGDAG